MIRLLDRNCDQAITFEEFCRFACMLPRNQIENNNVAFCWVDSADFMDGLAFRLNMVRLPNANLGLNTGPNHQLAAMRFCARVQHSGRDDDLASCKAAWFLSHAVGLLGRAAGSKAVQEPCDFDCHAIVTAMRF